MDWTFSPLKMVTWFVILALTIILSPADKLNAYPTPVDFNGQLSRWDIDENHGPILFAIKSDTPSAVSTYEQLIFESAELWNEVPTSYFQFAEAEANQKADITINLDANFDNAFSSGYATITDYTSDGFPKRCEIHVSVGDGGYYGTGKTLLHELGHCIGLGHSLIPQAIMSYRNEENDFALDTDDMAAVSRLYPANGDDPGLPPGCAITKKSQGYPWPIVILLFIPIIVASHNRVRELSS